MAKYNFELKKKIVLEHLSLGVGSKALAKKYNVKSARQIRQWIHNYNEPHIGSVSYTHLTLPTTPYV